MSLEILIGVVVAISALTLWGLFWGMYKAKQERKRNEGIYGAMSDDIYAKTKEYRKELRIRAATRGVLRVLVWAVVIVPILFLVFSLRECGVL